MSHFAVLVVGNDYEKALAPFHEFECTNRDDEYVQEIDITQELLDEYEKQTIDRLKDMDGNLHDPYDDKFYRDPTPSEQKKIGEFKDNDILHVSKNWEDGNGYRPKIKFIPDEYTKVKIKTKDFESFEEFCKRCNWIKFVDDISQVDRSGDHKYGYGIRQPKVKVIKRTNVNKKWDWYVPGGRWRGFLKIKPEFQNKKNIMNQFANFIGLPIIGDNEPNNDINQCKKKYVDFEAMKSQNNKEAGETWEFECNLRECVPFVDLKHLHKTLSTKDFEEQRDEYWRKLRTVSKKLGRNWFFEFKTLPYETKEHFIKRRAIPCTFAVLKDGIWHERGNMGWWAIVTDEKDDWPTKFQSLWDSIDDEETLTIIDCHI